MVQNLHGQSGNGYNLESCCLIQYFRGEELVLAHLEQDHRLQDTATLFSNLYSIQLLSSLLFIILVASDEI